MEIPLRYGLNPHQRQARLVFDGEGTPLRVLNGAPSYINILDALGAWQLARELKQVAGVPGAASFKHVSPAGAAIARPLSPEFRASQMLPDEELSPVAQAYARARGGDRMCSFGDFAAVSDVVDVSLASLLRREVSDGIIAPGYEPEALEILKQKRGGNYPILEIDPDYEPPAVEHRQVFGFELYQERNAASINPAALGTVVTEKKELPADVALTLAVATIALKYTQSNSVCVAYDGQVIGMGAGQQSRVHCTRLACGKADKWFCQQHPRVLALPFREGLGRVEKTNVVDQFLLWDELSDAEKDALRAALTEEPQPLTPEERAEWIARFEGVALSSDAFIPFRDTIDRAHRSGVRYVLQAGGSVRDDEVTAAADSYGMVMIHSGMRWFLH
ncbi:MAG TPA: phosphoribosylaminoimidazolecarboxamide formyltransferase [Armatimonadota bacterium]|nr:phosphoribosylaminoimidazolecarboxamide formyltransferase [Armatimonadota bacterium]HOM82612.1 phosphoribosylaminoimidazolecarboxamide formyltransferase [Armatimonadota bacterium]HPO74060.1 phosphoribosylaminoimidazolecarboxamide formyltransferase [Armatimonadota bacterium]HPT99066.1 phosphoribosylaminoimidazolecarboxamide formyltransferase [Armatimonadota bacterium]